MSREARARLEALQEQERGLQRALAEYDREVTLATAARDASVKARADAQRELEAQFEEFARMREFLVGKPNPNAPAPPQDAATSTANSVIFWVWVFLSVAVAFAVCGRGH